jgi:hypothetical protein
MFFNAGEELLFGIKNIKKYNRGIESIKVPYLDN